jgi:hypothetical protein
VEARGGNHMSLGLEGLASKLKATLYEFFVNKPREYEDYVRVVESYHIDVVDRSIALAEVGV